MKFKIGDKVKINIPGHSLHNKILKINKINTSKYENPYNLIYDNENKSEINLMDEHLILIKRKNKPIHQVFNI